MGKNERAYGAVLFCEKADERIYLLIKHSVGQHWSIPKGRVEGKETEKQTATREIEEETGISDFRYIDDFKEEINYFVVYDGQKTEKKVVFYIAKANTMKVKLSDEHTAFKWLNFKDAINLLTFQNTKDILKKADDFLSRKK